ncbi:hypothetical protein BDA99DRAFT_540741 [Phascolomyces articulosus]|uniref:Uncharacterized protein n=1 Tax=Phascolomyces articulosus TaxID=60185 RepID=A0AAD5K3D6_9FUNG|nr:hypothetical protein BDA99DRAFT_540741 [Phascolomyces articulosus]
MSLTTTTILTGIHCTRTIVLILAIVIVATSLSIYSTHTIPIFSLFSRHPQHQQTTTTASLYHENHLNAHETTVLLEMIQDRRLISTLVAAQASVFCPLFLLLTTHNYNSNNNASSKQQETTRPPRLALDLICCHVLMPFGLALSWIFCILFDRKTMTAILQHNTTNTGTWMYIFQDMCLLDHQGGITNGWACFGINMIHGLKYLIVLVLFLEIELVIAASFFTRYEERPIQLENSKMDGEWNVATSPSSFMDEQQRTALLQHHYNKQQV